MLRRQGFRFKLRPTAAHSAQLAQTAGGCRWVWNEALTLQHVLRDAGLPRLRYAGLCRLLTRWRARHPWLAAASVIPQQQTLRALDRAYADAFAQPQRGFPRRKKKGRAADAMRYAAGCQLDDGNGRVLIPKLGWMRYRRSRAVVGTVKQVHVQREADGWYVAVQTEREVGGTDHPAAHRAVGIDRGVVHFATLSTGEVVAGTHAFRRLEARIVRAQRALARKEKFSANWRKAQQRVARLHQKAARMRADHLHKASTTIAKSHGIVVLEDLRVASMTTSARGTAARPGRRVRQKARLNAAILDQGWSAFAQMLAYKLAWLGGQLVLVPAAYTSQRCHACGHTAAENRPAQAEFRCVHCGHAAHADVNAARNILAAGQAVIACGGLALVGDPMKQEPPEAMQACA